MPDFTRRDPLDPHTEIEFSAATDGEGPVCVFGQNNASADVTWKARYNGGPLPWADRHAARRALLGSPSFQDSGSYSFISRWTPHDLRDHGADWLYCVSARVTGRGQRAAVNGAVAYEWVYITARYEGLPFVVLEDEDVLSDDNDLPDETLLDRYVSYETESRPRLVTLPQGSLYWADPANPTRLRTLPVPSPPPTSPPQPQLEIRPVFQGHTLPLNESIKKFTWYQVPRRNFNFAAWDGAVNKCNAEDWPTAYGLFLKETMLLENWKPEFVRLPNGEQGLNATAFFKYFWGGNNDDGQPKGWNWMPDRAAAGELRPVIGLDPSTPYSAANPAADLIYVRMIKTFDVLSLFRPIAAT